MKTCYIYSRVSTDEQAKHGYSIEAQKNACAEYAKKLGYSILEVFTDEGETATAIDRPGFQKMLNQCEDKPVEAVVVWQTDRFARNEIDHFLTKDKLNKLGVRVLSVAQPLLDDSPEGMAMDGMMAVWNAYFSRDLSRKTKKGLMQKWNEGWWVGWAPLGYINTKGADGKGIVSIDKTKGPIIKEGLELFSSGNYTIETLQNWFFEKGLRSKTNKILQYSVVHNVLRGSFYYGLMRWNGLEKIGNHKPLIDKATYDLNQYVLAKHRDFLIRQRKHNFLLRAFIYCEDCGQRYTAEFHYDDKKLAKRGGKIGYYHCAKRGGCKSPYIQQEALERLVSEEVKKLEFSKGFVTMVVKKAREAFVRQRETIDDDKKVLSNQRIALEIKRSLLEDKLLDKTITDDVFKRKHMELQAQINAMDVNINDLEHKRQLDVDFVEEILRFTQNISKAYQKAPNFLKKHYLRFFFDKFYVKDKKIVRTAYSPIFDALYKENLVILRTNWLPRVDSNRQPCP